MADVTVDCPACQTRVSFPVRVDTTPEPGALRISVSVDEDAVARVIGEHVANSVNHRAR